MARYPDKYFELAIVDPPYGVGNVVYLDGVRKPALGGFFDEYSATLATLDYNQRKKSKIDVVHSSVSDSTILNFGDENVSPSPEFFRELFRISKNQIIWGGNYFLLPPSRGFVIWRKLTISETFTMSMCEFGWMSFNENAKIFECAPQGSKLDPRIHPTQKPVALYKWLLDKYAKPGDKILDTHLGSGSIAIACHDYGFDLTACELDAEYYNKAMQRINDHCKQIKMF